MPKNIRRGKIAPARTRGKPARSAKPAARPAPAKRGAAAQRRNTVQKETPRMAKSKTPPAASALTESYQFPEASLSLRPEVGTQAQFDAQPKNKKPPRKYAYDSSLSPAMDWDGQNAARERGEALIRQVLDAKTLEEAKAAAEKLAALSKPFLNWTGKAERLSFDVPTLPLFVHERLSTRAIIETLTGHKKNKQLDMFNLFGDPQHSVADQVLKAYEHRDQWVNRMILGDSLAVMNSLLHYEKMGGQVQMIYMDPPYGVKFGSNFQPFVRKRDVANNDDDDMTREPEMVQAYRDTWELGLHSYLTYMRDRLLLARDLLTPSGSIFVQISDDNLHHVREIMDEVFGAGNCLSVIAFQKTGGAAPEFLSPIADYLLWYCRDRSKAKYRQVFVPRKIGQPGTELFQYAEFNGGKVRRLSQDEWLQPRLLPADCRVFQTVSLQSTGVSESDTEPFIFNGKKYLPNRNSHWKTNAAGRAALAGAGRIIQSGEDSVRWKMFVDDYPVTPISNLWDDTQQGGFNDPKVYVVQTNTKVIQRCLLMTTDPGDLVLDPTCGSGTTAYVAEQWGRRWITADVSRVPLALARQRLLTATFRWYDLKDDARGPAAGFVYKRKQNNKGEEIGGIVPHVTLKSIANNEPPAEEVLVDRPEQAKNITRVCGPFVVEGTIPAAMESHATNAAAATTSAASEDAAFADRMVEVLRKSPVLRLGGNRTVTLRNVRPPTKSLTLSAEALQINGQEKPVAFVFGPESGAVSQGLVQEAAREAYMKNFAHLYVIGFAIQPNARELIEKNAEMGGTPATYVQATPDLLMGDLLKNMRSSQIFSVCGLPEIKVTPTREKTAAGQWQVELLGLDVFDPITMEVMHRSGKDVPAWLLDTDYNGLCFHVCQAFFPKTAAWDGLKKALKADYDSAVWDHLAGVVSVPFDAGEHQQIAVKVIDDRGNELLVVKSLKTSR